MEGGSNGAGPVGTPAVHANTANDASTGAAMPSVPANTQRLRPSDLGKMRRDGSLPTRADQTQPGRQQNGQPQTTRQHMAEKSRELEQRPGGQAAQDAKDAGQTGEGEADTLSELEAGSEAQEGEEHDPTAEVEAAPEGSLSDAEIVAKYRAWENSDLAPEEIFADKLHPVKVRGQERFVDYNELKLGYIRGKDYTDRGNELKVREQRIAEHENTYKQHFEAVKDPDQFLEIYERNGYGDTIEKVAEKIAARRQEHRSVVRAAGRAAAERLGFSSADIQSGQADNHRDVVAAMQQADNQLKRARSLEIENRKLASERERFESQKQSEKYNAEVQQHQAVYERQMNQLRPGALKANGIKDTPQNRVAFGRHLGEIIKLQGLTDAGITRDMTMSAARNMREEAEDVHYKEQSANGFMSPQEARAKQQADARRALGPNRVATGAGKPLQPQQSAARRPSEFMDMRRKGLLGK